MRIEYLYTEGDTQHVRPVKVRIDGKIAGTIKKVSGGYQYFPMDKNKASSEVFSSLGACQRSFKK
jgi:hypothetical protein